MRIHGFQDIEMDRDHPAIDPLILFYGYKWDLDLYRHPLLVVRHFSIIEYNQ
jgi:hypothetical protein